jgi:hypothetical protein
LGAFRLEWSDIVFYDDGLCAFNICITGTSPGGGPATSFSNLNIRSNRGTPVQFSFGFPTDGTVLDTDITDNMGADQSYLAKDTHLITPPGGWTNIVGGATESNDGSISTIPTGPWFAPHILGVGEMTSTSEDIYSFEPQSGDLDFLQVILQYPSNVFVSLEIFGTDMTGNTAEIIAGPIDPEPSTIAMLIFGGLSLLVIRRRKI